MFFDQSLRISILKSEQLENNIAPVQPNRRAKERDGKEGNYLVAVPNSEVKASLPDKFRDIGTARPA